MQPTCFRVLCQGIPTAWLAPCVSCVEFGQPDFVQRVMLRKARGLLGAGYWMRILGVALGVKHGADEVSCR